MVPEIFNKFWPSALVYSKESVCVKIGKDINFNPYSKFLVCNENIDQVIGYVDAKDILVRILKNQSLIQRKENTIRTVLTIPDTLTLSEVLDRFRSIQIL